MKEPAIYLLIVLFVTILSVALFRPRRGLFWSWRNRWKLTERVLIEDGLKHFYEAEYLRRPPTVQSIAGALRIPEGDAAALLARIESLGLVVREGDELRLTADGRADALRVIRLHRLWERYLADETGVEELEWHDRAEEREHDLSDSEAEALAERLGNPLYDPHGAPIPTADGKLPLLEGEALPALPVGAPATVIHLEDEPEEVYAQLVAEGLYLGMVIRLLEVTADRVRFWADGDEHVLAPVVAANVTVQAIQKAEIRSELVETLSSLRQGESGRVVRIVPACRGRQRRRLMDLGILPGTVVEARMTSAGGDPVAYLVRGTLVALRREQAEMIHIARKEKAA